MKKCIIYCFSGTGNTNRICKMILSELSQYDYEGEIFAITYEAYKTKQFPNPNNYDLIGVAYPGHAFNAPHLFNKFVKLLPKSDRGQQAFIIKSSGEPFSVNNSSSNAVKRYLRRKGYNFTYEKHYLMPYNIMFRYPEGLAKQMYLYAFEMAKCSAKKIVSGEKECLKSNIASLIMCFLGKIEWFGAWFNGLFFKVNKRKCIDCGLCAKNCPAQNITKKKGKYRFGGHCTLCCRCTMNCPKDAISMGLLNGLRVNGAYKFEKLAADENVSGNYVNAKTKGYYKNFNDYYDKIDAELVACGLTPPRINFTPDEYALMTKKQKKAYKKQQDKDEKANG
ncbi:MAG: EFR1 family ferrodoxin [Candidatus Coproplasma sp.]